MWSGRRFFGIFLTLPEVFCDRQSGQVCLVCAHSCCGAEGLCVKGIE